MKPNGWNSPQIASSETQINPELVYPLRFRGGVLLLGFLLCPKAQRKWIFHECKLEMRMRERFGTCKTINALMMDQRK